MATFFSRVTETLSWQEGENGLAKTYLLKEGDDRNRLLFTNHRLLVFRYGKLSIYPRENLSHISLGHRKWLAPLLGGGIIGGLVLFAMFKGVTASAFALILFMISLYLFYLGMKGSPALLIHYGQGRQTSTDTVLIPKRGDGLQAFIGYVNGQLIIREQHTLYLTLSQSHWQHLLSQGELSPEGEYFIFSTVPDPDDTAIRLQVLQDRLDREVRVEKNTDGKLEYRLYGNISRQQVRLYPTPEQEPVS